MGRGKKRSNGLGAVSLGATAVVCDDLEASADAFLAAADAGTLPPPVVPSTTAETSAQRFFINEVNARIQRKLPPNMFEMDQQQRVRAEGKALGVLSPSEQRKLVRIASEYSGTGRELIRERAAELLILTNAGFVEDTIRGHQARGLEEEVLRQECRLAIYDAIGRFDHANGASFLAFSEWRMKGAISEAIRSDSRLVRLKSRASEIAVRLERTMKKIEATGRERKSITAQELADATGDRLERVLEVLPWVTNSYVRTDGMISTKDGEISIADAIADDRVNVEDEVTSEIFKQQLRNAVSELPPYERRLVELYYNLYSDRDGDVAQKDLFDGSYRDDLGMEYSAEQSVIADRRNRVASGNPDDQGAGPIITANQKELNERFKRGELTFRPGTPEAMELYKLAGVPVTSATVQDDLQRAHKMLRPHLESISDEFVSRGGHAVEHSEIAAEAVRDELRKRALASKGGILVAGEYKLTVNQINELRAGKTAKSGIGKMGSLRKVGEASGHIDPETGNLKFTPVAAGSAAATVEQPKAKGLSAQAPKPAKAAKVLPPKVKPLDLIQAGVLEAGESLSLFYKGDEYKATLLANGKVELEDGRVFNALSSAAQAAKGVPADPGWNSWQVIRGAKKVSLFSLRKAYGETLASA